jgi:mannose-6-phosphate isomerase-like protein (cupin superfamily)
MKKIFKIGQMFEIPDGTKVSPFLNPLDSNEKDLPPEILPGMSIAAGEIPPKVQSKIHVHPLVSQVTWVIEGQLKVWMKGLKESAPYALDLQAQQAVFAEPQTFFQLVNPSHSAPVRVLYLVSPAYVFEMKGREVIYDDAIILAQDWEELAKEKWNVRALDNLPDIARRRQEAITRITTRKQANMEPRVE